jgi:SAM-dependent methyltransferase
VADIDEALRTSFDRNAELYHAARPSYPEAIVDETIARSGIQPDGRILEIGAGTGKATYLFARRGFEMLALEPGRNLAAVLRRNVAAFPKVAVEETTFEAWPGSAGSFDLVFSAQAFHWIDPAVRYAKSAQVLRRGGALASLRNETTGLEPALQEEFEKAYARWLPSPGWTPSRDTRISKTQKFSSEMERSGLFGPVQVASCPWTASYTTREYLDLLDTHSDHALLAPAMRRPLYDAIASAIERRGGRMEVRYVAVLVLTVRKD